MINADEARKLVENSKDALEIEATQILDAAIKAACQLGQRRIVLYKPYPLLKLAFKVAIDAGYEKVSIHSSLHQLDPNYLTLEW